MYQSATYLNQSLQYRLHYGGTLSAVYTNPGMPQSELNKSIHYLTVLSYIFSLR